MSTEYDNIWKMLTVLTRQSLTNTTHEVLFSKTNNAGLDYQKFVNII